MSQLLHRLSLYSVYALALLTPVFFLPTTSEYLEFNKQYLLYVAVTLGLLAWLIRGLAERTFSIKRTPLDVPLLILWVVTLLASLFSKDRTLSFFGGYQSLSWGFVPLTFYLLLYFLVVQNFSKEQARRVMLWLAAGGGVAMLYFWVRALKIPILPASFPTWNPTHALNSRFAVFCLALLMVGFLELLWRQEQGKAKKLFWSAVLALSLITAIGLGYSYVLVLGAIGLGLILLALIQRMEGANMVVASVLLAAFVLMLAFALFSVPSLLTVQAPTEIALSQSTSWNIGLATLKEGAVRMIFGSGPETSGYNFSEHRPASFNQNFVWSVRFREPSSQLADAFATGGILGALALLYVLVSAIRLGVPEREKSRPRRFGANPAVAPTANQVSPIFWVWVILAVALALIPFSTVHFIAFFLLLAFVVLERGSSLATYEMSLADGNPKRTLAISFGVIVLVVAMAVLAMYLGRFYGAEVAYAKGLRATQRQDWDSAITRLTQAAQSNPQRSQYQLVLARAQFTKALAESRKEKPDGKLVGALIQAAVGNARATTLRSPHTVELWETLAAIYAGVRSATPEAGGWARDAYSEAMKREATNPALYVLRGDQFFLDKKLEEAQTDYQKAVDLKPNYAVAHTGLSLVADAQKDRDKAVEHARHAAGFAPQNLDLGVVLARLIYNRNKGGDWEEAEKILRAVLERNANHANARFILGSILEKQGDKAGALAEYRKAAELDPNDKGVKAKIEALTKE